MIHHRRLRPPSHDYPADEWNIIEKGVRLNSWHSYKRCWRWPMATSLFADALRKAARMPKIVPSSIPPEEKAMDVCHPDALVFFGATAGSILIIARMSDLMRKVVIPLFVSGLFASMSAGQSATPVVVVDDFLKAWNSHDVKAFDRLFTQDAIWVPIAETRITGHADVIKEFEQIHTAWAKKTTIIARDIKVQTVCPDVAVILFHAKFVQDAKEAPLLDRAVMMVSVRQADGWRIATGQVTKQHEGP